MDHTSSTEWRRHLETATKTGTRNDGIRKVVVPCLTVLAHPDRTRVGEETWLSSLAEGRSAELSRLDPMFQAPKGGAARPLAEPRLSRSPIRISPRPEGLVFEIGDSRTEVEIDGQPVTGARLLAPEELTRGLVLVLGNRVTLLMRLATPALQRPPGFGLVGDSPATLRLRRDIEAVADLDLPLLLLGESGTGKELVARALQASGPRRDAPFLSLNMGAVPPNLAAAELFGAAKGAYSGADHARRGYFRRADGGTLFLDEIGETPPEVQALLLRVLEHGEIQPLGDDTLHRVDVRILAATDADLDRGARDDTFKTALLHRLRSFEIRLPPLRERLEDLGRLFFHFLDHELADLGAADRLSYRGLGGRPFVPARLLAEMALYPWPGNVRELRNTARRLAVLGRDESVLPIGEWRPRDDSPAADPARPELESDDLGKEDSGPAGRAEPPPAARKTQRRYRDPSDVGDEELLSTLRTELWNLKATAERLGVSRASLYLLIDQRPGIRKAADLTRGEVEAAIERVGPSVDELVVELEVSRHGLKRRMTELNL